MPGPASIVIDKEKIDIGLFKQAQYSLPDIMLYLNTAIPFVALVDGEAAAQCLIEDKGYYMDITHVAYRAEETLTELLIHIEEHYKEENKAFIEIGCGNANMDLYALFQRIGFRVIGVKPDYFIQDTKKVEVLHAIANIDMIRFRYNLRAKRLETIGSDALGRT
ncbi:MAG: hypothetical protein FWG94_04375 [Oscillospiraceae bacterium]|nr:hypothetical protein [Oscillospiraceae bacterium]